MMAETCMLSMYRDTYWRAASGGDGMEARNEELLACENTMSSPFTGSLSRPLAPFTHLAAPGNGPTVPDTMTVAFPPAVPTISGVAPEKELTLPEKNLTGCGDPGRYCT